jgi:TfoX/Sxy family transcriptional regulator of competence genes
MAYDERLAERVREVLGRKRSVREQKMFGRLCFMLNGNMCCGIVGDELMVRVGPEAHEDSLARPHARPMDFTGRPMRGMVYVAVPGLKTKRSLTQWVDRGVAFAASLPAK